MLDRFGDHFDIFNSASVQTRQHSIMDGLLDFLFQWPLYILKLGCDAVTASSLATSVLSTLVCGLVTLYGSTAVWRWYYESYRDKRSSLPLPPGSFGYPIVGETLHFLAEGMTEFVLNRRRKEGINKTHLLGTPMVNIDSSQRVNQLASKEPHGLASCLPTSTRVIIGSHGISVASGKEHASMKKTMTEAFTPMRLTDYLPVVQRCIYRHVRSWVEGSPETKMLGFKACETMVSDLFLETVVGCSREQDPGGKVRDAFIDCKENLFCIPLAIPGMAYYKAKKSRQIVIDFVKTYLREAKSSDKDFVTIMDVLLSHQHKLGQTSQENTNDKTGDQNASDELLSETQLLDNAINLMVAGSDAISSSFCSVLNLLGRYPEKLAAVRRELESQDLLDNGNLVNDFQIPANWRVQYSIKGIHEVTKAFDDAEKFLPERWLDPKLEEKLRTEFPCAYSPFGFGTRACVGKALALQMMSVFVIEVARYTDWTLLNPGAKRVFLPIEKPSDNLPMNIRKRK
ncbi:cytochrome P450 26A1-like [Elysia marginata]|uniref:Cytochrome P450 26A1-like n=1 Tax=Elysia marginata TaxID=1093978 RepID=A0AAV4JG08_9GAST|nr:cytochrome P450 26A1-like [Elysia marginata]